MKDRVEHLESCAFGPARLLYRHAEEGVTDGLVQFPLGESWDWGMVLVTSSRAMDAYTVLGVSGAANTPSGNGRDGPNAEFLSRVTLTGEPPDKAHKDFVITLADSPGGDGALVPALYAGICPAMVNIEKKEHTHAKAEGGGALKSGFTGFARIVHPPAASRSPGTQWCYVSIPESPPRLFPVTLEKTGGAAGDHETQCSFKYKAGPFPKGSGGEELASDIDPNAADSPYRRWQYGKMKDASFGLALYGADDQGEPKLLLAWCNEVPEVKACE